jgi:hypothetical protein
LKEIAVRSRPRHPSRRSCYYVTRSATDEERRACGRRVRGTVHHPTLPIALDDGLRDGECFATFHTASVFLDRVTAPYRDRTTHTPEYKVVAVRIDAAG